MGLFKRRAPWTPDDIPDMSFDGPTEFVDIGSLAGDEHREAFALLFARVLIDNREALSGFELVGIDAKRPLTPSAHLPAPLLELDAARLARELYDSRNETVVLRLASAAANRRLGLRFDDPAFWLEEAQA